MPIIPASNSGGGSSGSGGSISTLLGTAGEDISQYDVVYYTSSGTYKKSKNNGTEAEAECVGIATANIPNGSTGIIQIGLGTVTNAAWAFTPGDQLYVSGTYGSITNIVPTIIGDYVKPVGYATSATTIVFCPQDGWIVGGLSSHGSNHYPEGTDPIEVNIDSVGGRLDLVSSTRIKWSFLNSNQIKLYNPTTQRWELIRTSTEPTLVNTANDLNETALVPNTIYDIFAEYSSPTAFNLVASRWSYGGDGANNTSESYATPVMTANNAPGPITLTGNGASGYEEFYAFNQADGSSDTTGVWVGSQLMINFGQPVCINKYKLKSRNASQKNWIAFPKTWTLEGTNGAGVYNDATGTNGWTVLQTVSQSEDLAANTWETNYHTFENNKSYLKYRIVPSASWGTGYAINELKLVAASNSLAGSSSRVRAYEATVTYNIGDRVTYGGHDWVKISTAAAGTTPVAGVAWVDNGTSISGDFAGLYRHDGVLVSDSSTTGKSRRWLGIIYTYNNSGTVNFKDDVNYRYVSNYYNRKMKNVTLTGSGSWTCSSTTARELNNGTGVSNRLYLASSVSQSAAIGYNIYQEPSSANYYLGMSRTTSLSFSLGSVNALVSTTISKSDTIDIVPGLEIFTLVEKVTAGSSANISAAANTKGFMTIEL